MLSWKVSWSKLEARLEIVPAVDGTGLLASGTSGRQNQEISGAVSAAFQLHPGRQDILPQLLRNRHHHHAGIGLMTPNQVHYGQADQIHAARQTTPDGASSRNPERLVRKANRLQIRSRLESTEPPANHSSLNIKQDCLRIAGTFRPGSPMPSPVSQRPR